MTDPTQTSPELATLLAEWESLSNKSRQYILNVYTAVTNATNVLARFYFSPSKPPGKHVEKARSILAEWNTVPARERRAIRRIFEQIGNVE